MTRKIFLACTGLKISLLFVWVLNIFFFQLGNSQSYVRNETIQVTRNGNALIDAWAGGLNSPQFSRVDINLDGAKDLVTFDRSGNKFSVFLNNNPQSGSMQYLFSHEYSAMLPAEVRNWALFRDMNCDGKEDLCANAGSGIKIYWNESESNFSLSTLPTSPLNALYNWGDSQTNSGIFCISADIPAIDDYDGDGDMDIWSWNEMSDALFFYKNMSVENGNCESPSFECRNRCYGQFGESLESFSLSIGQDFECSFNVDDPRSSNSQRHTGGTILTIDLDQNGLNDLILGDVTANQMTALLIEETASGVDSVFAVSDSFPSISYGNTPAHFVTFLAGYYEDINNDGVNDLLVASNALADASDKNSIWLYLNTGLNDQPYFELYSRNFLQSEMLDLGTSAFPASADIDQDGLADMVLSSRKSFDNFTASTSQLWYLHNHGTAVNPSFEILDTNWLNLPQYGLEGVYPSFGDVDADGDQDLLLGLLNGEIYAAINTAGNNNPMQFPQPPFPILDHEGNTIDVGQTATPVLYDIDENGTLDIVSGNLNGTLTFYKNMGSNALPSYDKITDTLGLAVATSLLGIQGRSVPVMLGGSGIERRLIMGTETGQINEYAYVPGALEQPFVLISEDHGNIFEGERAAISSVDLNNDQQKDLIVGNWAGGVAIYSSESAQWLDEFQLRNLELWPNPTSGNLYLSKSNNISFSKWKISDTVGRVVAEGILNDNSIDVPSSIPSGIYMVLVEDHLGRFLSRRVVVHHP
jgi:hypothetical protein